MDKSVVYMPTKINSGIERKKTDFNKGDIAYLPTNGSICFYLGGILNGKPMTPIGRLVDNFENLNELKSGDILTIYSETA